MNTPPGDPRDVALTADVADGATVAPGEDIMIRLSWDPEAWSGPDLDRALACVHVKGVLDPELSAGERPTANDGVFEYRLHVPEDIKPDCDICVLGFLAGEAAGGGPRMARSDRWCVMSGPPAPPPPAPPVTQPPAPPATEPPAPATTTTTVAAAPSPDVPAQVAGVTETRPEPAALAEPAPAGELPRTGGFAQLVTGAGGLSLTLGGLGVIGGAGRRPRRRTTVSSEM